MDVTPFLDIRPAPRAVFDRLANQPELADKPRFYRPARTGWEAVTWAQFAQQIRQVALYLADLGLRPGERAAIYAPNRVEWASAAMGIQAVGGVMVPIYPASMIEQLAYVLDHSDARLLFVDTLPLLERVLVAWPSCPQLERVVLLQDVAEAELAPLVARAAGASSQASLANALARISTWSSVMATGARAHERRPRAFTARLDAVEIEQPGLMLYTSGTSGNPKGVPLTHRNVGVNAADWLQCLGPLLDEDMVDLLWLPMSHIFGLGEMCLGNTLAFTSYMVTPQEVLARMTEVRPSVLMSVPAYWEKLASVAIHEPTPEARKARLMEATGGQLRFCLSGGAGLKREVKDLFHECGMLIIEGYGLTETSPTLTLNQPASFRFDTVGKPLTTVELRLAADGEILARGPNVFAGYHKDPAATAACFTEDGWFCTGDIGRFTEDGFLQIVDRKKDILVTAGGKNIPPSNIELRFRDDPLLEHVVVYGDGKKYLVAGVWVNREAVRKELGDKESPESVHALVAERIARVNSNLASYETIKRFCVMGTPLTVEAGYLTSSLKLRRKQVYQAFRADFEALYQEDGKIV